MIKLVLPFPPSLLNPNKRNHWAEKMPVKNKFKQDCFILARQFKPTFEGNIPLTIDYYPPANRGDLDNMLAASKALFDGISEAWGVNDKRFRPLTIDIKSADKLNPRTEVFINYTTTTE